MIRNHTWDPIERLANEKVEWCKSIYKVKEGILGVEPKGFTQKKGVNLVYFMFYLSIVYPYFYHDILINHLQFHIAQLLHS